MYSVSISINERFPSSSPTKTLFICIIELLFVFNSSLLYNSKADTILVHSKYMFCVPQLNIIVLLTNLHIRKTFSYNSIKVFLYGGILIIFNSLSKSIFLHCKSLLFSVEITLYIVILFLKTNTIFNTSLSLLSKTNNKSLKVVLFIKSINFLLIFY